MPGGRPKNRLDLRKGWKEAVLSEYEDGASDVEVRVLLKQFRKKASLSNDLWVRWMAEEREFSDTIKQGREASERWWLRLGRGMAAGKIVGNATTWIFNMKNRFNWADKREVESIISAGAQRGSAAIQAALEAKLTSLGIDFESAAVDEANAEAGQPGEAVH